MVENELTDVDCNSNERHREGVRWWGWGRGEMMLSSSLGILYSRGSRFSNFESPKVEFR